MRVLWLCNIVLPKFSKFFNIKPRVDGGWLTGAWRELETSPDLKLGICCPIIDEDRRKNGVFEGTEVFSFPFSVVEEDIPKQTKEFCKILKEFKPDIIHIWGTEMYHSYAMVMACEKLGYLDKTLVSIQGLVSVISKHYCEGIPLDVQKERRDDSRDLNHEVLDFEQRGLYENELIRKISFVSGRTDWDCACTSFINRNAVYFHIGEILRDGFYENANAWNYDNVEARSIFISQAMYPIKGFHYFLRALILIRERFPDTKVYVAGRSPIETDSVYGDYILRLIEENELKDTICFLGSISEKEMIERYKTANVFVSASLVENESNSVREAMMIGTPVVASFVGGVMDVIEHNVNGYLYSSSAPYMLAYYVSKIFDNQEIAKSFSKKAFCKVRNFVDKEQNRKDLLNAYKAIGNDVLKE